MQHCDHCIAIYELSRSPFRSPLIWYYRWETSPGSPRVAGNCSARSDYCCLAPPGPRWSSEWSSCSQVDTRIWLSVAILPVAITDCFSVFSERPTIPPRYTGPACTTYNKLSWFSPCLACSRSYQSRSSDTCRRPSCCWCIHTRRCNWSRRETVSHCDRTTRSVRSDTVPLYRPCNRSSPEESTVYRVCMARKCRPTSLSAYNRSRRVPACAAGSRIRLCTTRDLICKRTWLV